MAGISSNLVEKLLNKKYLTWVELEDLALFAGYCFAGQNGSHRKYKRPNSPLIVITDSPHHQNSGIKILKEIYEKEGLRPITPSNFIEELNKDPKRLVREGFLKQENLDILEGRSNMTDIIIEEKTKVPGHLLESKDWRVIIRGIRTHYNKTLTEVASNIPMSMVTYQRIETTGRCFTDEELLGFCKYFKIDINDLKDLIPTKEKPEPRIFSKQESLNETDDIVLAAELKLARFKELHLMLKDYDKLLEEYNDLKKQFMPLLKEL